jgi:hypothetical protein
VVVEETLRSSTFRVPDAGVKSRTRRGVSSFFWDLARKACILHTPDLDVPRLLSHFHEARVTATMPVPTGWHPGEIAAQQARGYEDDVWGMWQNYQEGAPSFMVPFLSALPFLSVTTLDEEGMPWASLLCNDGHPGFLEILPKKDDYRGSNRWKCTCRAGVGVPIRHVLQRLQKELAQGVSPYHDTGDAKAAFQLAAVGVMLHNRRRNKIECVIVSVDQAPTSDDDDENDDTFVFQMDVVSTFGNCPKCKGRF